MFFPTTSLSLCDNSLLPQYLSVIYCIDARSPSPSLYCYQRFFALVRLHTSRVHNGVLRMFGWRGRPSMDHASSVEIPCSFNFAAAFVVSGPACYSILCFRHRITSCCLVCMLQRRYLVTDDATSFGE